MDFNLQVYEKGLTSSSSSDSDGGTESSFPSHGRGWLKSEQQKRLPQAAKERHIGTYALTTELSSWVKEAVANYQPTPEVLELVAPFAAELHNTFENERGSSTGLHDIDAIELTYQFTVEVGAAILLAANATNDPVDLSMHTQLHASKAGGDDHFSSWGKLLTGLDCDPPIIVQFPFYLMMCQSFTFEPVGYREDYIYSALTGVDWVRHLKLFSLPAPLRFVFKSSSSASISACISHRTSALPILRVTTSLNYHRAGFANFVLTIGQRLQQVQ